MKKILSMLLALSLALSLTACGQTGGSPSKSSAPAESGAEQPKSEPAGYYPITVTDHAGREVVIEKAPEKLVSCYYITTSLLIALDLDEKMVGIEDNPGYRPIYARSAPHLLELPWMGTAKVLNAEACAALEPDLVILPLRLRDSAEILEQLGIDVLLVNPESQVLLTEMIRMIACATNTLEIGEALITFLETQEQYLKETLSDAEAPCVYLAGNSSLLSTAGNAMYQSDMIRLAGGENVAAEIADAYWTEVDYEQMLVWNPDYIILSSSAKYTVDDVLADPNLAGCAAVASGNVYQLPSRAEAWDSPVPSGILGALWLANVLHKDRVRDADCAARMDEYYETFYDFTYSEN